MRARVLVGLVAALAASMVWAAGTGATKYKWRDAAGALHYSDSLPPEAVKFGYEVVNGQGLVIKRVQRAKTAEELAADKAQAARDKVERAIAEQRERDDAQLLSMYDNEAALKAAHQQQLDSIDQEVKAAEFSLRGQEQALADLLDRAAAAERGGKNLPEAQTQRIADLRAQIEGQQQAIARRQADREAMQTKLEAEVQHFRELKAKRDAARSSP
ncbi:MAG: DUF4124 domain-containing protein [Dokdonella sp.]|uniref:DUF4124 domain-containing protein n=1 Tax=Dokdonella sp. TaxID=2291710 RepID=UPI0025C3CD55|nr:DUF4124 domain-containing protein [Dokdonella sp.]MBZ0224210.1 DUF4124 domain-containing protein [Dokdonella sp.]